MTILAQERWEAHLSGTDATLHGATYGGGQFVLVGERGTILTSSDGLAWTPRPSGTSATLMAVTHASGHFIAVGDASTVLVSRDAKAWSPIEITSDASSPSSPHQPRRLRAIGWGRFDYNGAGSSTAPFNAVGDDGAAVWGHPIDSRWTGRTASGMSSMHGIAYGHGRDVRVGPEGVLLTPSTISASSQHHLATPLVPRVGTLLEAITFGHERFVAVGRAGIGYVSTNATTWSPVVISSGDLFAITYWNGYYVAVGHDGAISRSRETEYWFPPLASVTRQTLRAIAGSATRLVAAGEHGTIVSSPPVHLMINVREGPVSVTTTVGGAAGFRVVAEGTPPIRYLWIRDNQAVPGGTDAALTLNDVTTAQAGTYHVRMQNPHGDTTSSAVTLTVLPPPAVPSIDRTFRADAARRGALAVLLPLTDGRVVVASLPPPEETIAVAAARVVRLARDGRIDPIFTPGRATTDELGTRSSPTITQILEQPDGRMIVVGRFDFYDGVRAPGIVRILANGGIDESFAVPPSALYPARALSPEALAAYVPTVARQPDGKLLVIDPDRTIIRLSADGSRDPSFSTAALTPRPTVRAITVSRTGRILVGTFGQPYTAASAQVFALREDGQRDPAFATHSCNEVDSLYATEEGGAIVCTRYDSGPVRPMPGQPTRVRFPVHTFRLRADGTPDPGFPMRDARLLAAPTVDGRLLLSTLKIVEPDGRTETTPYLGSDIASVRGFRFGPDGALWVTGSFNIYHGLETAGIARLNVSGTDILTPPRLLSVWADRTVARVGEPLTLHVAAVAPGPVAYTWFSPSSTFTAVTAEPHYTFVPRSGQQSGDYAVRVANSGGTATSATLNLRFEPGELRIVAQPREVRLPPGRQATALSVELAASSSPVRWEWRRNGQVIRNPPYGAVDPSFAGTYTLTLTDLLGQSVTSAPMVVSVADVPRFTNLSTRSRVGAGERGAVLGFVIPPGQPRSIVLRGIGPALANFGVTDALPATQLELFTSQGELLDRSRAWERSIGTNNPNLLFDSLGAFRLPAGSADTGLMTTLRPGAYTARLSSVDGSEGTGLIELYERDNWVDRLINLSSRVQVGGQPLQAAAAGFTIAGGGAKRVLVRAVGPGLRALGVAEALDNPMLEIYDATGRRIAANDDWHKDPAADDTAKLALSVGAFPLASLSNDAALVLTLAAGGYTAVVSSADETPGIALIEVYEMP